MSGHSHMAGFTLRLEVIELQPLDGAEMLDVGGDERKAVLDGGGSDKCIGQLQSVRECVRVDQCHRTLADRRADGHDLGAVKDEPLLYAFQFLTIAAALCQLDIGDDGDAPRRDLAQTRCGAFMAACEPDQDIGIDQVRYGSETGRAQLAHIAVHVGHILPVAPHAEHGILRICLGALATLSFLLDSDRHPRIIGDVQAGAPCLRQFADLHVFNHYRIHLRFLYE